MGNELGDGLYVHQIMKLSLFAVSAWTRGESSVIASRCCATLDSHSLHDDTTVFHQAYHA